MPLAPARSLAQLHSLMRHEVAFHMGWIETRGRLGVCMSHGKVVSACADLCHTADMHLGPTADWLGTALHRQHAVGVLQDVCFQVVYDRQDIGGSSRLALSPSRCGGSFTRSPAGHKAMLGNASAHRAVYMYICTYVYIHMLYLYMYVYHFV